jgi:hypothetical protein
MKFALVNGTKKTPTPKESGFCVFCNAKVISKCGNVKVWHWAHRGKLECDPWWENETQWHRDWKNKFPEHYQERIAYDEKGEKHIADVKTDEGWVLEFQHSFLKSEERNSRNNFYEKLVWVVDGNRRMRDKVQFSKLISANTTISLTPKIHRVYLDDSALLRDWSRSPHSVFFDFGEDNLWCVIPSPESSWGAAIEIPRSLLISIHNREDSIEEDFNGFLSSLKILVSNYELRHQSQSSSQASFFQASRRLYRYPSYRKRFRRRF